VKKRLNSCGLKHTQNKESGKVASGKRGGINAHKKYNW
jgi:hypothetical protein